MARTLSAAVCAAILLAGCGGGGGGDGAAPAASCTVCGWPGFVAMYDRPGYPFDYSGCYDTRQNYLVWGRIGMTPDEQAAAEAALPPCPYTGGAR